MAMIKFGFGFFTKYWQEIAIGIVCGALFFVTISWWSQAAEIGRLKTQLTMAAQQNETLQTKVDAFETAEQIVKENQAKSLKDREIIVTTLTKEINKLRTQVIPKDCNGAVNYGIQFKDDMKWPERSYQ
jgi:hypothetical protein